MVDTFRAATAVTSVGDGRYTGRVAPGWDIVGNANGGYLLALASRAMAEAVGRPPLTVTGHFLAPGRAGPCEIEVRAIRMGRRTATASAVLRVEGTDVLALLGTFADPRLDPDAPSVVTVEPPDLPPLDECLRGGPPTLGDGPSFGDRVVCWYHPDDSGFALGEPSGSARMRAWCHFADEAPIDVFGLVLMADVLAPVVLNRPEFPPSWAPTLELTVHIRSHPAPGPVRGLFESRVIRNGVFEEDGVLFDAAGSVVAQSRQLALIPREPSF